MGEEIFIDANIFLEILLNDNHAESCTTFLRKIRAKELTAVTSDFLISTCLLQIMFKKKKYDALLKKAILFFNSYEPLYIFRPSMEDSYNASQIMKEEKLDYDDSLVLASMRKLGIKKLATLDKHFKKIKEIEIVKI
jgi:predicted nucleic acid-binding protein